MAMDWIAAFYSSTSAFRQHGPTAESSDVISGKLLLNGHSAQAWKRDVDRGKQTSPVPKHRTLKARF